MLREWLPQWSALGLLCLCITGERVQWWWKGGGGCAEGWGRDGVWIEERGAAVCLWWRTLLQRARAACSPYRNTVVPSDNRQALRGSGAEQSRAEEHGAAEQREGRNQRRIGVRLACADYSQTVVGFNMHTSTCIRCCRLGRILIDLGCMNNHRSFDETTIGKTILHECRSVMKQW